MHGDGAAQLNTIAQLRALRLHHILFISDSAASCAALRAGDPHLACVWSSLINASKPSHGSVCVKKYWDMRFFFYDLRSALAAARTAAAHLPSIALTRHPRATSRRPS